MAGHSGHLQFWLLVVCLGLTSTVSGHTADRLPGWQGERHRHHTAGHAVRDDTTTRHSNRRVDENSVQEHATNHALRIKAAPPPTKWTEIENPSYIPGCGIHALRTSPRHSHMNFTQQPVETEWLYQYEANNMAYTHMAMMTILPNGTVLVIWQASERNEGDKLQHFELSSSMEPLTQVPAGSMGDVQFNYPEPLRVGGRGGEGEAVWGPTFFLSEVCGTMCGTLWLFYSQSKGACLGAPPTMHWAPGGDIKAITMDLATGQWSTPRTLYAQEEDGNIPKVTANKMIELKTGEWLLPFWKENALLRKTGPACRAMRGHQGAGVLRSTDKGSTWVPHGNLVRHDTWLIENALVQLHNGTVLMIFRTRIGEIYRVLSHDTGITWSDSAPLGDPALPNPNAKVDVIALDPTGALALVYNDHTKPPDVPGMPECIKCRTKLSVALSMDSGNTWSKVAVIEDEIGASLRFHYPTIQQYGCNLFVAYSKFYSKKLGITDPAFDEQGIKLARISLDHIFPLNFDKDDV